MPATDRLSQAVSSLIEVLDLIDYATGRVRSEKDAVERSAMHGNADAGVRLGELANVLGELAAIRGFVVNVKGRLER